jgi:hypothetical protein
MRPFSLSSTVPHGPNTRAAPVPSAQPRRGLNARRGPTGRRRWVVSTLAAAGVFATVLASQAVHGQPPHRGQRSTSSAAAETESANTPQATSKPRARATDASSAEHGGAHARGDAGTRDAGAASNASARGEDHRREPEPEPVRVAMRAMAAPPADAPREGSTTKPATTEASRPPSEAGRDRRRGTGTKRTVIQDEFLIEGKLEKPSAYYVLRRSSLDYDWARLDAKFSPLVLESVQDPLF